MMQARVVCLAALLLLSVSWIEASPASEEDTQNSGEGSSPSNTGDAEGQEGGDGVTLHSPEGFGSSGNPDIPAFASVLDFSGWQYRQQGTDERPEPANDLYKIQPGGGETDEESTSDVAEDDPSEGSGEGEVGGEGKHGAGDAPSGGDADGSGSQGQDNSEQGGKPEVDEGSKEGKDQGSGKDKEAPNGAGGGGGEGGKKDWDFEVPSPVDFVTEGETGKQSGGNQEKPSHGTTYPSNGEGPNEATDGVGSRFSNFFSRLSSGSGHHGGSDNGSSPKSIPKVSTRRAPTQSSNFGRKIGPHNGGSRVGHATLDHSGPRQSSHAGTGHVGSNKGPIFSIPNRGSNVDGHSFRRSRINGPHP